MCMCVCVCKYFMLAHKLIRNNLLNSSITSIKAVKEEEICSALASKCFLECLDHLLEAPLSVSRKTEIDN